MGTLAINALIFEQEKPVRKRKVKTAKNTLITSKSPIDKTLINNALSNV